MTIFSYDCSVNKLFQKRIYLDFASITPISKIVSREMKKGEELFANPSSLYKEGVLVRKKIESSRKKIGSFLNARAEEIFFTSGGTEGNNIAILGVFKDFKLKNKEKIPHFVTSTIEHSSVLECMRHIEKVGGVVTYITPDESGIISPKSIKDALRPETILVSIQMVNNEIGTIEPIAEIAKEIRHFKKLNSMTVFPLLHTDACQAFQYIKIDTLKIHSDLLTLDSSKIYGPRGAGVLYVKKGTPVSTILYGGFQESGLRSGTENISAILGTAKAFELTEVNRYKEFYRQIELQKYFLHNLSKKIGEAKINGSLLERVPGNVNFYVKGLDAEFALFELDSCGILVSTASSCVNNKEESYSYVIKEINPGREKSSLRVSFGCTTTKEDIDKFFKYFLKTNSYKEVIST